MNAQTDTDLRQMLSNIGWLYFAQASNLVVSLLVGLRVASYLGPLEYGRYSYALSFVAIFSAISMLGLNGILVRDIAKRPDQTGALLGTAFWLRVGGAAIALCLIVVAIVGIRPDDNNMQLLIGLAAVSLFFNATDVVRYYFEAEVRSKYAVWVDNAKLLVISAAKLLLVFIGAPLIHFIYLYVAESILIAAGLLIAVSRVGVPISRWSFEWSLVRRLINDAWPQIISGFSLVMYLRIDKIMIGQMLGDHDVGVYSIAVSLSEACYFIGVAINATLNPSLFKIRDESRPEFLARLQRRFDLMVWLGVPIAILLTLFGSLLIQWFFSDDFSGAIAVLWVHAWATVFVFLNNAAWGWYLAENRQGLATWRIVAGLLLNVGLNIIFIPRYGIMGAAWATLVSRIFVGYFGQLLSAETRPLFTMMTRSLFFVSAIQRTRTSHESRL